jgi:hypothetical protein
MEFVSDEHKTIRGFPHLDGMAYVRPATREETQWVMVIPVLEGCAEGS